MKVYSIIFAYLFIANVNADSNFPGGTATSSLIHGSNVFSQPSASLSTEDAFKFRIGDGFFRKRWIPAPASAKGSDGLGPLFNAISCQSCHIKDGRGAPPVTNTKNTPNDRGFVIQLQDESQSREVFNSGTRIIKENVGDPTYGRQFQDQASAGKQNEGYLFTQYDEIDVELNGGEQITLHRPQYQLVNLGFGPVFQRVRLLPRVAPPMIGLGLLDAVDESEILQFADPDDADNNGISGKPNWAFSFIHREVQIGRFGWKANSPSIKEQSAIAFSADLGLSTSLLSIPSGDCTEKQTECVNAQHGAAPGLNEVSDEILDLVAFYSSNLAVPTRRDNKTELLLQGEEVFHQIGCANCHRPSMTTSSSYPIKALRNQRIYPYSDLLLHDMGEGLADVGSEGLINRKEWRTQPLWGIGLAKIVNNDIGYLHDGRAKSIREAIVWHDGEAAESKKQFINLEPHSRNALIHFLKSI